ncbi:MAG: class F sortase [Chloroflexi bacterium]|nr:MAG: class F sortase [Chloroflexota bacterium]
MLRKLLIYVSLFILVVLSVVIYNYKTHATFPSASFAIKVTPWQPTRLQIPSLHIDAPVMGVGATASGQMDAPVSSAINSPYWTSVFWYAPGVAPGQAGNAVVAGHVDRAGGGPAVFWSLATLRAGDSVFVQTRDRHTLTFVVEHMVKYTSDAPERDVLQAVFGPTTEHHLNLITCSGAWTGQGYDERLVVFTTQVNGS